MTFKILSLVIAAFFVACSHAMVLFQTPFSSQFSLRELAERSKATSGLNCEKGASGGGGGGSNSIFAGGKSTSHYSKSEDLSCQLKNERDFDEAGLMKDLSQTIEQDLKSAGARIIENKMDGTHSFYFRYELKDLNGKIQISGRAAGNYYFLNAILAENSGDAK